MKYSISTYTIWEYGQRTDAEGKPHQEDALFPLPGKMTPDSRLFVLCDGMGGHDAGEIASATVCDAMASTIGRLCPDPDAAFTDDILRQAINDAFDALDSRDTHAAKKMGTTMTMLRLHPAGATIAHIGDSRVYHIRPGVDGDSTRILFETSDHSLVNDLLRIGELTPEQARDFPQKNVLTRAMQPHMPRRCRADVYHTRDIRPGDLFFLCSDGMLEQMTDDDLKSVFSDVHGEADADKVAALIDMTAKNHDNHTAIIVRINDVVHTAADVVAKPAQPAKPADSSQPATAPAQSATPAHDKAAPRAAAKPAATRKVSRRSNLLLYILIIIAAAAVVGAVVYLLRSDNKPVVQRTIADDSDDRYEDDRADVSNPESVARRAETSRPERTAKRDKNPAAEAEAAPEADKGSALLGAVAAKSGEQSETKVDEQSTTKPDAQADGTKSFLDKATPKAKKDSIKDQVLSPAPAPATDPELAPATDDK